MLTADYQDLLGWLTYRNITDASTASVMFLIPLPYDQEVWEKSGEAASWGSTAKGNKSENLMLLMLTWLSACAFPHIFHLTCSALLLLVHSFQSRTVLFCWLCQVWREMEFLLLKYGSITQDTNLSYKKSEKNLKNAYCKLAEPCNQFWERKVHRKWGWGPRLDSSRRGGFVTNTASGFARKQTKYSTVNCGTCKRVLLHRLTACQPVSS